jgi:hypothetical protein
MSILMSYRNTTRIASQRRMSRRNHSVTRAEAEATNTQSDPDAGILLAQTAQ